MITGMPAGIIKLPSQGFERTHACRLPPSPLLLARDGAQAAHERVLGLSGASPDAVIVSPTGKMIAVVEAKSRVPFCSARQGLGVSIDLTAIKDMSLPVLSLLSTLVLLLCRGGVAVYTHHSAISET